MQRNFQKIGLWGRLLERSVAEPALQISAHLQKKGLEVYAPVGPNRQPHYPGVTSVEPSEIVGRVDLLVAVGGDGNLLRAAKHVARAKVPLVGINRGRLGFLTDISPDEMLDALDAILAGDYLAEERQMLEARISGTEHESGPMLALNDVVLQRGEPGHTMDFVTEVDGSFVNSHAGDGLIVATATGSTAYALSCGGPIIQPNVDAFVMVPIAPHTLSDRPLLLKGSSRIEARVVSGADIPAYVACDGEEIGRVGYKDMLHIGPARETVMLLHPRGYNYYELLRSKLNWGRNNRSGHGKRSP